MAARYEASATYHSLTSGPNTRTWTTTFWWRRRADPGALSLIVGLRHTTGTHDWTVQTDATGDVVRADINEDGGAHDLDTLFTATTDTWYFIMLRRDDTSDALAIKYLASGGSSFANSVTTTGEFTPDEAMTLLRIGNVDSMDQEIAAVKIWSAALSDADALTERSTLDVTTNTGSEWANYQFLNGALTTDSSGNGRTLTANNTPAYVADPSDLGATAAVTGTATASITEADIVSGGKTIVITLSGDTWVT